MSIRQNFSQQKVLKYPLNSPKLTKFLDLIFKFRNICQTDPISQCRQMVSLEHFDFSLIHGLNDIQRYEEKKLWSPDA